ncbi:MAG: ABC transporter substrate-binding protein [Oscillospiraceae bacterium]|nr:ABC transporter substrate-binding protein [Oscillospiraceae bacterium]MDD4414210.1 ABC transporter substrate-binding protein [Oscillospiraceae bacterium]
MKKMRIVSLLLVAIMLMGIFAGCKTKESDTIKIGGLAPLTGDVANYGKAVNNAVLMAVKDINEKGGILGKQIEYIYEDEKGDPTEAVNAYNKLVEEGIVALVGDVTSKPTKAVALKAKEDNMPMITASGTEESITLVGNNVFRTCFIDPYQGQLMASYASKKLNAKTAAIIYDTGDPYSTGIADAFETAAKSFGMTITNKEGYTTKSTDFNTQLTKIKTSNPEVIMVPVYYSDVALIAVQAKNHGITAKLLGADGWDSVLDKIDKSDVDALANGYFCSQYSDTSTDPNLQNFLKEYKETYEIEPNMFSVLGYDSMQIMAAAIEKAGSTDADKIIDALKSTDYAGLTGTTTFDGNRNPIRQAFITSFEDNKYKFVELYSMS